MVVFLGKGSLCGGGYWVFAQAALKGGKWVEGAKWHPASVTCPSWKRVETLAFYE
jgi:hypothetical protein